MYAIISEFCKASLYQFCDFKAAQDSKTNNSFKKNL